MVSNVVLDFRQHYRKTQIPKYYSGVLHFCFTNLIGFSVIGFSLFHLDHPRGLEWLTIPITFIFANFVEYRGHRGPMHHPVRWLRILYGRHTIEHHSFFTHNSMAYESTRDFKMVLFPPVMIVFFIGLHAIPVGLALYHFISPNVAYLFAMMAIGYFLTYEWLHLSYHLAEDSWVGRLSWMKHLRQLHTIHHNPTLMNHYNFNITFPIFDLVFKTKYRPNASVTSSEL